LGRGGEKRRKVSSLKIWGPEQSEQGHYPRGLRSRLRRGRGGGAWAGITKRDERRCQEEGEKKGKVSGDSKKQKGDHEEREELQSPSKEEKVQGERVLERKTDRRP